MIETVGLAKTYSPRRGSVQAVRGVDLRVEAGEIFGFLGPNGAGKTTTLRMLTTVLRPSAGRATVAGADLFKRSAGGAPPRRVRRPGRRHRPDHDRTSGAGHPGPRIRDEQGGGGGARGVGHQHLRAGGVRGPDDRVLFRRPAPPGFIDLALGLVHSPKLVFLDEPTTALDPQSRAHLWTWVRRLREEGMTVFLTTHYLDEADSLCDRVAIIDHGEIVAQGSPDELKKQIAGDVLVVGVTGGDPEANFRLLGAQPYVREIAKTADDHVVRLYVEEGETATPEVLRLLDANGLVLSSLSLTRPSLDDVFLRQTGQRRAATLRDSD